MAEIPVTKKSGIPWWVWAILAVIVIIILFLFLGGDDEAETGDVAVVETADVITDLSVLANGTPALDGRAVRLDDVRVQRMYGDRGFTVTDGTSDPVFVVLDEAVPGPNNGADGAVDVNAGQTIDLRGEVAEVRGGRLDGEPIEDLPAGTTMVVHASDVLMGN